MKVGILTHYNVSSQGALLQMYGLKKALEEFGHEVFILTYTRNLDFIDEATKNDSVRVLRISHTIYLPIWEKMDLDVSFTSLRSSRCSKSSVRTISKCCPIQNQHSWTV